MSDIDDVVLVPMDPEAYERLVEINARRDAELAQLRRAVEALRGLMETEPHGWVQIRTFRDARAILAEIDKP